MHAFKKNLNNLSNINAGILMYPILMAADILLYDIDKVYVGKDQLQHIELTRNLAKKINYKFKNKIFNIPKAIVNNNMIKGIDGNKMSKSKNNYINIFDDKNNIKKKILSIKTFNVKINKINNFNIRNNYIMYLYNTIFNKEKVKNIENKFKNNNYGFYNAKIELYNSIINKFDKIRKNFSEYINKKKFIDYLLKKGEKKIRKISNYKINYIKKYINN